ncbi:MAG: hypothetical protein KDA72_14010, partial [Planctomycetales bacterium]|nr:hypothetical protein [Planctomycetales bacterium]
MKKSILAFEIAWLWFVVCLSAVLPEHAQAQTVNSSDQVRQIRLEAFVRSDLPAAEEVETYAADLRQRVPGLDVVVHDVLNDRPQLIRLHELTKRYGGAKAVVPSFYGCNRMVFGFANAETSGPKIERLLTVEVYTRATCQRCQAAKAFIAKLRTRWPALRFRILDVSYDNQARLTWEQLCRGAGKLPGLPTIDFAGQVLVGYQSDETSGAEFERLIEKFSGRDDENSPHRLDDNKQPDGTVSPAPQDNSLLFAPLLSHFTLLSVATRQSKEPTPKTHDESVVEEIDIDIDELLLPAEATQSEMS